MLSLLLTYLFCFFQLVEAFHATLEEVVEADMLVVGFVTFLMSSAILEVLVYHEVDVVFIPGLITDFSSAMCFLV
jgi:hypothetical protein